MRSTKTESRTPLSLGGAVDTIDNSTCSYLCRPLIVRTTSDTGSITFGHPPMNEYFRPVRRKYGVGVLVAASLFMAGWVRSLQYTDSYFQLVRAGRSEASVADRDESDNLIIGLWSCDGALAVEYVPNSPMTFSFFDSSEASMPHDLGFSTPTGSHLTISRGDYWKWNWAGVGVCESSKDPATWMTNNMSIVPICATAYIVSYWTIIIPLTLLSSYLLLSKPRQKTLVPHLEDHQSLNSSGR